MRSSSPCLLALMLVACTSTHGRQSAEPSDQGAGNAAREPEGTVGAPSPGASGGSASDGASSEPTPVDRDAGTSTPGEPPITAEPGGAGDCLVTFTALDSIDADTPFGYRARDILDFAVGGHETVIRWLPIESRVYTATYTPESGEHGLTVGVLYTDGEVRLMHREPNPNSSPELGGCSRGEWLEIDVELEVTSDGGALAERHGATLLVHNELWVTIAEEGPERELDCARITADALAGSFELAVTEPEDYALREVCLSLLLSPAGVNGLMWGTIEQQTFDPEYGQAQGELEFALIGEAGCDRVGGMPIAVDDGRFGTSGQSLLDMMATVPTALGTWQDGSTSRFTLVIEHGDGPACTEPLGIDGWVGLESQLRIFSDDGRVDGTWPIDVFMDPEGEGAVAVNLPDALAFDQLGIGGIDVDGYELVMVAGGLEFVPTPQGVEVGGAIEITGLAQAECPRPPPGEQCPEPELLDWVAWDSE